MKNECCNLNQNPPFQQTLRNVKDCNDYFYKNSNFLKLDVFIFIQGVNKKGKEYVG